jgi:hypothetical protein
MKIIIIITLIMRPLIVFLTSLLTLLSVAIGNENLIPSYDLGHFLEIEQKLNEVDLAFEDLKEYTFSCQYLADFAIYNLTPLAE